MHVCRNFKIKFSNRIMKLLDIEFTNARSNVHCMILTYRQTAVCKSNTKSTLHDAYNVNVLNLHNVMHTVTYTAADIHTHTHTRTHTHTSMHARLVPTMLKKPIAQYTFLSIIPLRTFIMCLLFSQYFLEQKLFSYSYYYGVAHCIQI